MSFREPESMDECFYFTNRILDNGKGSVMAWAFKPDCPKCKKAKLGKPVDPKTGKVKTRAKEYICPECKYTVNIEEIESTLPLNVKYKCPHCGNEGETTTEYKRKSFNGIPSYVFVCQKCKQKIGITKKMKEGKKEE